MSNFKYEIYVIKSNAPHFGMRSKGRPDIIRDVNNEADKNDAAHNAASVSRNRRDK